MVIFWKAHIIPKLQPHIPKVGFMNAKQDHKAERQEGYLCQYVHITNSDVSARLSKQYSRAEMKSSGQSKWGRLAVFANNWWSHPGYTVEYCLCSPNIEMLTCHGTNETAIKEQPLLRGLFRFICKTDFYPRLFLQTISPSTTPL